MEVDRGGATALESRAAAAAAWARAGIARLGTRPDSRPALLIVLNPAADADSLQALLAAASLHRRGVIKVAGVVANGGPVGVRRFRGAAAARRVLDHLGATDVPVAAGAAALATSMPQPPAATCWPIAPEPRHAAEVRALGVEADGVALLKRVVLERGAAMTAAETLGSRAEPPPLTLVCLSALTDAAALLAAEPAACARAISEVVVQGGLRRDDSTAGGWAPDDAANNVRDVSAASAIYAWCLAGGGAPLCVISRHAVPALPMQLAASFAVRSGDALAHGISTAQRQGLEVLWRRVCAMEAGDQTMAAGLPARCTRRWFLRAFCGLRAHRAMASLAGADAEAASSDDSVANRRSKQLRGGGGTGVVTGTNARFAPLSLRRNKSSDSSSNAASRDRMSSSGGSNGGGDSCGDLSESGGMGSVSDCGGEDSCCEDDECASGGSDMEARPGARAALQAMGWRGPVAQWTSGHTRPYAVVALLAALPHTRHALPAPEVTQGVSRAHRLHLRQRHAPSPEAALRVIRDCYHDAILLAQDTKAKAEAARVAKARAQEPASVRVAAAAAAAAAWVGIRSCPAAQSCGAGLSSPSVATSADAANAAKAAARDEAATRPEGADGLRAPNQRLRPDRVGPAAGGRAAMGLATWALGLGTGRAISSTLRGGTARSEVTGASSESASWAGDAEEELAAERAVQASRDKHDSPLQRRARREAWLARILDAAICDASSRQWRLALPLATAGVAIFAGAVRQQLKVQDQPAWYTDLHVTVRSDLFACAYLCGVSLLALALQPTRSFLALVRGVACAVTLLYTWALAMAAPAFARQYAERLDEGRGAVGAIPWEAVLVLPLLAGSAAHTARALRLHWREAAPLVYELLLVVGTASLAETCGVLAKRTSLGWLAGSRGWPLAVATLARTVLKGGLSGLLLWPRFRARVHGVLATALAPFARGSENVAALAPLLGFGGANVADPVKVAREMSQLARPRVLDAAALRDLRTAWGIPQVGDAAAIAAAQIADDTDDLDEDLEGSSGAGTSARRAQQEDLEARACFVVHSAADSRESKVAALEAWVSDTRAKGQPVPVVWLDAICGDVSLKPEERPAQALAALAACSNVVVLAGAHLPDDLWAATLLQSWACLGRKAADAEVVIAAPAWDERAETDLVTGLDAFAVMYAKVTVDQPAGGVNNKGSTTVTAVDEARTAEDMALAAQLEAQLVLAVEIAGAGVCNEAVRSYLPKAKAAAARRRRARVEEERAALGRKTAAPLLGRRNLATHLSPPAPLFMGPLTDGDGVGAFPGPSPIMALVDAVAEVTAESSGGAAAPPASAAPFDTQFLGAQQQSAAVAEPVAPVPWWEEEAAGHGRMDDESEPIFSRILQDPLALVALEHAVSGKCPHAAPGAASPFKAQLLSSSRRRCRAELSSATDDADTDEALAYACVGDADLAAESACRAMTDAPPPARRVVRTHRHSGGGSVRAMPTVGQSGLPPSSWQEPLAEALVDLPDHPGRGLWLFE